MIIGINGYIGSGKDTVGQMIQYLQVNSVNPHRPRFDSFSEVRAPSDLEALSQWKVRKFAYKLKQMVSLLTGISVEGLEKQEVKSQELGKEWDKWYVEKFALVKAFEPHGWERQNGRPYGENPFSTEQKAREWWEGLVANGNHALGNPYLGDVRYIVEHMTVRELLQKLGTEAVRNHVHPNAWVNALFAGYNPIETRALNSIECARLMSIWKNINTRCTNPNYEKFHRYGGKGIINEFPSFLKFIEWAAESGYTNDLQIDRQDTDDNYSPSNCRWVHTDLQAFNKGVYKNSLSGTKGVSLKQDRVDKKYPDPWVAQIQFKNSKQHIGYYSTEEEATLAYKNKYQELLCQLEQESKELLYKLKYPNWIITDVRFSNEAQAIKDRDGIVIRINRPWEEVTFPDGSTGKYKYAPGFDAPRHSSETSLDDWKFDYVIDNSGSIEKLLNQVLSMLQYFKLI